MSRHEPLPLDGEVAVSYISQPANVESQGCAGLLAGKCASSLTHSLGSLRGYTRGHYDPPLPDGVLHSKLLLQAWTILDHVGHFLISYQSVTGNFLRH